MTAVRALRSRRTRRKSITCATDFAVPLQRCRNLEKEADMSTKTMTIEDKAVLVTGANRGIGQALVEEAVRRGSSRVYAGTRGHLAHADERVTPVRLDVTDASQIQAAVEGVESLDVLINNAGVSLPDDLGNRAALERHLAVNLFGTYGVTQALVPLLTRSRGSDRQPRVGGGPRLLPPPPGVFALQARAGLA